MHYDRPLSTVLSSCRKNGIQRLVLSISRSQFEEIRNMFDDLSTYFLKEGGGGNFDVAI